MIITSNKINVAASGNDIVAKFIRKIRLEHSMTGSELAKLLKISQQQISRYERGINKMSLGQVLELLIVLDIPLGKFYKYLNAELHQRYPDSELISFDSDLGIHHAHPSDGHSYGKVW
ncbi:helix-turn-helix domain-containing protein [Providencia alcalifaciens]|uniref:helix-turn-helix domain-containing protein n=1 Tax=Providencia TaxID=586 RepID=UPI0018E7F423|nr:MULTISPECIES: helix-turn-helix transcriptional regulator [Providencia]EJD6083034.1 helix-turn-helix transcriptional regulator [Providencia rettgeri]EJD6400702.1 helix-turn-helix transcriptional regulator [Providencia rettgeri]EJD6601738.1 helix-turn-helix transcriptional regulator [Providencia rettgeri]EJD6613064.1 helix-turn-helix transcriptional regulator [Providencia rettgeri]ELL9150091.1 helix-turn-helix transcriptional regulator [Providencia rettgeri]